MLQGRGRNNGSLGNQIVLLRWLISHIELPLVLSSLPFEDTAHMSSHNHYNCVALVVRLRRQASMHTLRKKIEDQSNKTKLTT